MSRNGRPKKVAITQYKRRPPGGSRKTRKVQGHKRRCGKPAPKHSKSTGRFIR